MLDWSREIVGGFVLWSVGAGSSSMH
eukprot:COSAG01_NODE_45622_length_407_cov_8.149351_2_plen_25_part_01